MVMRRSMPIFSYVVVMVDSGTRHGRYRRHRMNSIRGCHRMRALPARMRVILFGMVAGIPVVIIVMPPIRVAPHMITIIGAVRPVSLAIDLGMGFKEMI
jgi:hypothetical protein